MTMIEKVARAICVAEGFNPDSTETTEKPYWMTWEPHARAAIEALRTPTPEMVDKGGWAAKDFDGHGVDDIAVQAWAAMITAALGETDE